MLLWLLCFVVVYDYTFIMWILHIQHSQYEHNDLRHWSLNTVLQSIQTHTRSHIHKPAEREREKKILPQNCYLWQHVLYSKFVRSFLCSVFWKKNARFLTQHTECECSHINFAGGDLQKFSVSFFFDIWFSYFVFVLCFAQSFSILLPQFLEISYTLTAIHQI